MNDKTLKTLNYYEIKETIKLHCVSDLGKKLIDEIVPKFDLQLVKHLLSETDEARNLINNSYTIPLKGITDISSVINKIEKELNLDIDDFMKINEFLRGCSSVKSFFINKESYAKNLASYSLNITEMPEIIEEINRCIKGHSIDSNASKELKKIRKHIDICESKIKEKLEKFIKNAENKQYIQEPIVVQRNEKYTIPIKSSYKTKIDGVIVEQSAKGSTVFIEPNSIAKLSSEYSIFKIEEEIEIYRILTELSSLIFDRLYEFQLNVDIISKYDMIFAKGKYSFQTNSISPKINNYGRIDIVNGVHPLIHHFEPLNFNIEKDYRALIITGPNAGGKTVVLKTVGLLTLMTMSGFHIQASADTQISLFQNVFVDIGDNQSIENSLSTFSSHMQNLAYILSKSNKNTLVLLDEIGSGTEPNEGAGLGIAILEQIYRNGAIILATTHYSEIKLFSEQHPSFENAKMEYENLTLEPLYRLKIGSSGESNAFYIAQKMGIPDEIREKALKYIKTRQYDLSVISSNKINANKPNVELTKLYSVGDRVQLLDYDKVGIVYKANDTKNNVIIFVDNSFESINIKRLKLIGEAKDLYPVDYDLNSLFVSFKERKFQHDMERGSKKALKQIKKEQIRK